MARGAVPRVRREIEALSREGLDWVELSDAVGGQIRKVVGYDGACWHTMDPETLLLTGNVVANLPDGGLPVLAACEYGVPDFNKWAFLARQRPVVAGRLHAVTQGQPELSNRYRTLLEPAGIQRELRVSFVDAGGCWGSAGFYRFGADDAFTEEDVAFLESVSDIVAAGYRRALVADLLDEGHTTGGQGLVVLDRSNEVQAISAPAERWLAKLLARTRGGDPELPAAIVALAARVRSIDDMGVSAEASARVRTPEGEWLSIMATPLQGRSDDGLLGITIEPAGPPEIAQLLITGYGLSEREQEVAYAVLRGATTKQIAKQLSISPHTVQDHLKVIFDKVGVRSRRELVSFIYSEHYVPHVAAGRAPTPDGWFGAGTKPTSVSPNTV